MRRDSLVIDPQPRTLSAPGTRQMLDGGRFALDPEGSDRTDGAPVPLGEIHSEEVTGHLLLLSAFGTAASPNNSDCDLSRV